MDSCDGHLDHLIVDVLDVWIRFLLAFEGGGAAENEHLLAPNLE